MCVHPEVSTSMLVGLLRHTPLLRPLFIFLTKAHVWLAGATPSELSVRAVEQLYGPKVAVANFCTLSISCQCILRCWGNYVGLSPPSCISYGLVQAAAGVGIAFIWYLIQFDPKCSVAS